MKKTRIETDDSVLWDAHTFWNSSTKKRAEQSHYIDHGPWSKQSWLQYGNANLEMFRAMRERYGDGQETKRLLEWGCGGGANIVAFAEDFDHITGVDIAVDSLTQCDTVVGEFLPDRDFFRPFVVAIDNPFAARQLLDDGGFFDAVLCMAVFHHMPSARYAHDVVCLWAELTRPGAQALVQFRTHYHSRPKHRSGRLKYHQNVVRWLMMNPAFFVDMVQHAGWEVMHMVGLNPQRHTGYVDAMLRRR